MPYSLAIFDLDGTLADSFPWFLRNVNDVADRFGFRRIEENDVEELRHAGSRYAPSAPLEHIRSLLGNGRKYLFIGKPKEYIGHNPLAQFAMFTMFMLPMIVLLLTGFALFAEGAGIQSVWYTFFGWVFSVLGDSMTVHTWHHVAMWVVLIFALVHMYMAIREDMTHRQTAVSSMISGWRFFR